MQNYKVSTLKSGLKVLTVPSKEVMSVKTEMIIKTGAEHEIFKKQGISHVLEHMSFKGTEKYPEVKDISREIDTIGGIYNAYTGNEVTGYWTKVDKRYLDKSLDIISDMYLHPLFPEKELIKEKGVIIEEIRMYKDNPKDHVEDVFADLMYGKNNPGGWSVAGTIESVNSINRKDLVDYATKQYTGPNSLLVISGNFDEKKTLAHLNNYLGTVSIKAAKQKNKVKKLSQKVALAKLEYRDISQCHLILGFPSFNCFSSKKYALKVLLTILDGGMSARLFNIVRDKLGAAYYIHASNAAYLDYGFFCIDTGLNVNKVNMGLKGIVSQLKEMMEGKISEEEFKNAKTNINGKLALRLDSVYNHADRITRDVLRNRPYEVPEEYLKKIDKITIKDVSHLATEIFKLDQLNLAMVSPFKQSDGRTFLREIEKGWRS
ncbi:MAG: pitrilysin family protein [Minisyncoccia bacterium]